MDNTYLLYFYSTIAQSFAALIALTLIFWTYFHERENKYLLFKATPLSDRIYGNISFYRDIGKDKYIQLKEDHERFHRAIKERNGEMMIENFLKIDTVIVNTKISIADESSNKVFSMFFEDYNRRRIPYFQHLYLIIIVKDVLIRLSVLSIFLIISSLILLLIQNSKININCIIFINIFLIFLVAISLLYFLYLIMLILSDNPDLKVNKLFAKLRIIKRP